MADGRSQPNAAATMLGRCAGAIRSMVRRQGKAGGVALVGVVGFAAIGIGGPLVGVGSFSASEQIIYRTPWVQEMQTPPTDGQSPLNDTYEQIDPAIHEWASRLRHGDLALTSPYEHGGTLLTAWTADGFLDPMNLPWLVLPVDLAPGYAKLLEIAVAAGFMYLFCRRLGVGRAPAWIGGLAYAACGFQIAWTNWPHSHVGAVTPAIFWAIERLVQLRRWRDVSVLAATIAWSLAAGFPSVTLMALVVAAIYTIVRLVTWDRTGGRAQVHEMVRGAVMAGIAAALALGVMAVQLVGLSHVLSRSDLTNREAFFGSHADKAELATSLLPAGLGLPEWGGWVRAGNVIEAQTFVGGAVALMALGVVIRRRSRREPRGLAPLLVAVAAFSLVIVFVGGPLLTGLQRAVPPLADNYIGRWRSVLGFTVATLAALGANRWVDDEAGRDGPRRWWWFGGAAALVLAAVAFVVEAVTPVPVPDRPGLEVDVAVLGCAVVATIAVIWLTRRQRRWGIGLIAPIIAVEALAFVLPFWHRSPDDLVYPPSPLVSKAAEVEGHDRVEGVSAIGRGLTSWYRLRTATGYSPAPEDWADLVTLVNPTLPRTQWATEITTVDQAVQQSAILDRLGVRYLVVGAPAITGPLPADWTPIVESPGGVLVERSSALARIRWASTSTVVADRGQQLATLSAGPAPSTILLDAPSGAAEGGTGRVTAIDERDSDVRRMSVTADGPGYLVVADAYDPWWHATIDGQAATVIRADHAMMAIPVRAGDHVVTLRYSLPRLPIAVSVMSVAALLALVGFDVARGRRRE